MRSLFYPRYAGSTVRFIAFCSRHRPCSPRQSASSCNFPPDPTPHAWSPILRATLVYRKAMALARPTAGPCQATRVLVRPSDITRRWLNETIGHLASEKPIGELARALRKAALVAGVTTLIPTWRRPPIMRGRTQASIRRSLTMAINPIQIQKSLKGVDYPASKSDLLKNAEREGADEEVRATLEQLPDEEYESPADVSEALGKIDERVDEATEEEVARPGGGGGPDCPRKTGLRGAAGGSERGHYRGACRP